MHDQYNEHLTMPIPVAGPRWRSQRDLCNWTAAFTTFFPRKAHLADKAAAKISGAENIENLYRSLPLFALPDPWCDQNDRLFSARRMVGFEADRLTLIHDCRILPDAADLFLTACPVGANGFFFEAKMCPQWDESLCYYRDDQEPSPSVTTIVASQRELALSQTKAHAQHTLRLGEYHHPLLAHGFFQFLELDFKPDAEGIDGIDPGIPLTRLGWVEDADLGSVECFSIPFTACPYWRRDEVFYSVLTELTRTRQLRKKPVVLLGKHPLQLVHAGQTYTSVGHVLFEASIEHLFVTPHGLSLADLIVETVTFNPATSTRLVDTGNLALSAYWSLLRQSEPNSLPEQPKFRSMPDNWMIPN